MKHHETKACVYPDCGQQQHGSRHEGSGADHDYEKPAKQQKARAAINQQSEHGAEDARDWRVRRDAHRDANPTCQLPGAFNLDCWSPAGVKPDVHHITPRGMGGTRYDDSELVTLCRRHHDNIELHRAYAKAIGLLKRRPVGLAPREEVNQ